jgi:hypothetical protein
LKLDESGNVLIDHERLGHFTLHLENKAPLLFCDNETNNSRLYGTGNNSTFVKDGINDFLINRNGKAIHLDGNGTKVAVNYDLVVKSKASTTIRLRLSAVNEKTFEDFDDILTTRIKEADEFYAALQSDITSDEVRIVQRQAFAGMLWSKQFYYYDIPQWLKGDPAQPPPDPARLKGRNHEWIHLNNADIISMPDKWEYPWYAA